MRFFTLPNANAGSGVLFELRQTFSSSIYWLNASHNQSDHKSLIDEEITINFRATSNRYHSFEYFLVVSGRCFCVGELVIRSTVTARCTFRFKMVSHSAMELANYLNESLFFVNDDCCYLCAARSALGAKWHSSWMYDLSERFFFPLLNEQKMSDECRMRIINSGENMQGTHQMASNRISRTQHTLCTIVSVSQWRV